jgi:hypothetical protein
MNELIGWLKDQNEGVCTYTGLQQRAHAKPLFSGYSALWLPVSLPRTMTCHCPRTSRGPRLSA